MQTFVFDTAHVRFESMAAFGLNFKAGLNI